MSTEKSIQPFEDPLENYDAPKFDDPVEQALHDASVTSLQSQPFLCVDSSTSVRDAMKLMTGKHISCVLVTEDAKLVGVFGDRDVLDKVALEYDDVIDEPVSTVMSTDPAFVGEFDSAAKALAVMVGSGYRHIPIVNDKSVPIGIISPQRFSKFLADQ